MEVQWNRPSGFLTIGGIILVLLGVLGFFLIGPTAADSIFGPTWWFDGAENWAHLVLGVVALILVFAVKNDDANKWVTAIVGILALVAGIWGFFNANFLGAGLELLDNILHLVVGVWALYAAFAGGG